MKAGSSGPEVIKLQEQLIALGYPLPRWGADGELGSETIDAVNELLADHWKSPNEDKATVTPSELAFINTLSETRRKTPLRPTGLHDLRQTADRRKVIRRRTWKEVTGITLHQTACVLGERTARWNGAGCHIGVTREGKVIWLHDFDYAVVHGNGFNGSTVGIELDGHYAGIDGDMKTYWRPKDAPGRMPQTPTNELIVAAMDVIRWICEEVSVHGGRVTQLLAHRQSSKDRQSDPGSALWQKVALPMMSTLSLSSGGKDYKIGSGAPIPEAWDQRCKNVKY